MRSRSFKEDQGGHHIKHEMNVRTRDQETIKKYRKKKGVVISSSKQNENIRLPSNKKIFGKKGGGHYIKQKTNMRKQDQEIMKKNRVG
jgi:hypothetical protein